MGRARNTNWGKMNAYTILVGKPEGRGHREHLDVGGWTILK
jgi:hypothetical protein